LHLGLLSAALAFIWWGLFPLYFRIVTGIAPLEILAHRVSWCLLFLLAVLTVRRQWRWLPQVLRQPKVLAAFVASSCLIGVNWMTYIWSVNNDHVVDASLGYFITPLFNVLLGYTLLQERPRRVQWVALGIAALGVVWLTVQTGRVPWIALVLAVSFSGYGILRKLAVLGPLEGLTLETIVLAPFALAAIAFWWHRGTGSFPSSDLKTSLWFLSLGPVTAIPLLLFAAGARRLSMTTLGLVQYSSPTIQLLIGVLVLDEPFGAQRMVGFACTWIALLIYTLDGWRVSRRASPVLA
jgi:chloramphenicol-sensitive protein RarD